jgi:hypothetical protein
MRFGSGKMSGTVDTPGPAVRINSCVINKANIISNVTAEPCKDSGRISGTRSIDRGMLLLFQH